MALAYQNYSSELVAHNLESLEWMINFIGRAQTETEMIDNKAFAELVKQSLHLGVRPESLCEEFGINRSNISRWANGKSAPQPYIRPLVVKEIGVQLEKLLEEEMARINL